MRALAAKGNVRGACGEERPMLAAAALLQQLARRLGAATGQFHEERA